MDKMKLIKIKDLEDGFFIFMLWKDEQEALDFLNEHTPGRYELMGSREPEVLTKPYFLYSGLLPF
jgi:hypothetical protein